MRNFIPIAFFLLLFSCTDTNPELPFVGKWAGLSSGEYFEAYIVEDTIFSYGLSMGSNAPIPFVLRGDSLYYSTWDMIVSYRIIDDSVLIMSNSDFSDTLYRMSDSIITFDEVDQEDIVTIKECETAIFERANIFYMSRGYKDYWDYNSDPSDTIFEELIIVE